MAARKLKFKPKPLVSATVRRGRDKDDVSELTQNEPTISGENIKEHSTFVASSTDSGEIPGEKIVSSSCNLQQIKTEHCGSDLFSDSKPIKINSVSESEHLFSDSRPTTITSVSESECLFSDNRSTTLSSGFKRTLNHTSEDNLNSSETNDIPVSITSEERTTHVEQKSPVLDLSLDHSVGNVETSEGLVCLEASEVINNSHTKDSSTYDKSPSKQDVTKGFSRFGRSRCKPVLNNSGLRRKNDGSLNSDCVSNASYIRTDSVIKCVKSEINNAKTITAEITESFSLLDENETCDDLKGNDEELTKVSNNNNQPEAVHCSDADNNSIVILTSMTESSVLKNPSITNKIKQSNGKPGVIVARLYKTENHPIDKTGLGETLKENNAENLNTNISNKVPISPLRTSKILVPKPSPRLSDGATRRISFQGSDSEDEVKWKHPIKSEKSKVTKEKKEKKNNKRKRSQGSTYSKMGQDTLEKFTKKFGKDETPDKNKLTMLDLIFYNPKNNPMPVNPQTASVVTKKEEKVQVDEAMEEALAEQSVDDVEPAALPVPQLKVGPDGQVMLDPKSLVIETTGMEKSRAELEKSQVIQETGVTRYSTYSKRKQQRRDWTQGETVQFYKALSTIGTDFTLMAKLFPTRSRHELKLKFKREEKLNMNLIDKALMSPALFDYKNLEQELKEENEEIAKEKKKKEEAKEASRKRRAERKEEKLKSKDKKKYFARATCKPLKDFNESDKGKQHISHKLVNKSRGNKRKPLYKAEAELIDSELEEELHIDVGYNSEDEEMSVLNIVKKTCSGRVPKRTKKLEEFEELNETLKKKLRHDSDSEDDVYTPNGPGAHMLFGSPTHIEEPPQEPEEGHWNIEISTLPTIEETVLLNDNVEDVSELSELGSFGQNDSDAVLDLSMPVRGNIQRDLLQESHGDTSLLNRHIISQSIQIIDQLTANVDSSNIYNEEDIKPSPCGITAKEDRMPLPSFESVSRSRPSMVYPFISADCDSGNQIEGGSSRPGGMVLVNLFDSEECILGD